MSPSFDSSVYNQCNIHGNGNKHETNVGVTHIELHLQVFNKSSISSNKDDESHQDPFVENLTIHSLLVNMWISSCVVDSVQYLQEENQLNLLEWIFLYENWNHNKDESSNHEHDLVVLGLIISIKSDVLIEVAPLFSG